ncbi:Kinetochore protein Spc24 [Sporothrix epigloea]|uniref:Kinetochore protein Spc24 n=1 Tax=Sporothrix epigloea TaxID=1892477 RepID=A0ABP0D8P1_9PEZI
MSGFFSKVVGAFTSRKTSSAETRQDIRDVDSSKAETGAMSTSKATIVGKNPMKRLFEEDDNEEIASGFGKAETFTINEEYAKRYEHNKKREEKQKLEEKYGKTDGSDDDSDSSSDDGTEDEDGYLLTEDLDARMSAALQAIKAKDPRLYDTDAKFFDAAEAERAGLEAAAAAKNSKQKPIYLKDYHRERYMRGDVGADDGDGEDAAAPPKTYQQEQAEIKQALIDSMNADDNEGGLTAAGNGKNSDAEDSDVDTFIKPKKSTKATGAAATDGAKDSRKGRIQVTKADVETADKDPALFLSNFLASRSWAPDDDTSGGPGWEAFDSEEEDEEGMANPERAEAYETAFNLRFEDPSKSNEVLKSYSRTVVSERSVRREEKTARQRAREQERAQKEAAKLARREERARLRKLNIDEAQEKLAKIKQAAGVAGRDLAEDEWMGLLDDAWDNDAWESKMEKHFGDDYYAEKDADLEDELVEGAAEEEGKGKKSKAKAPKKPKWDDDIDIKDLIPDFEEDEAPKITLSDDEEGDHDEDEDAGDEDENGHDAKRRKTGKDRKKDRAETKREARRERARIEALVDRNMELDNPAALASGAAGSVAGGNTGMTGFRYRETSPQAFGLTARDILLAPSDTVLNEFAGLKKLATFRDEERKRKDRKKLGKKARLRQWRRDTFGADFEHTGPTFGFEKFIDEENAAEGQNTRASHKTKHRREGKESQDCNRDNDTGKTTKRKRSRTNKGKA